MPSSSRSNVNAKIEGDMCDVIIIISGSSNSRAGSDSNTVYLDSN